MIVNEQPNFPLKLTLRIDWCDMDIFKHVNNVVYFKYIQSARVHYWEQSGLVHLYERDDIIAMLLSTQCRYIKPLHYPGNVIVQTSISFMKNTSFGLLHQLLNENEEVVAEAQDIMVLMNARTEEKISIPESIRTTIKQLEGIK